MRMIDRWFPCAAVSDASHQPYGSGKIEKALFTWFAARPIAQARAAVLTTLLPWPEDRAEQRRLQDLVIRAVNGDGKALAEAAAEIRFNHPDGVRVVDPFSGRAMIPLEAARAGAEAWGIDYSPVATLAGMLLADFPLRDWGAEPTLPFSDTKEDGAQMFQPVQPKDRLSRDIAVLLREIGDRHERSMDEFYPRNGRGERPWGYLWAQTIPCDECKNDFPMVGSAVLRLPNLSIGDPGACYSFVADRRSGELSVIIHDGIDAAGETLLSMGNRGKVARCPFCHHPHMPEVIKAKAKGGLLRDKLLIIVDQDPTVGMTFRLPDPADTDAVLQAEQALGVEAPFPTGIPAVPDERLPPNNYPIDAAMYGVTNFGGLCCKRQTLNFVRLCRTISDLQGELLAAGCGDEYTRALLGYAGAVVVRKLRYSTRGATLRPSHRAVHDIFMNQARLSYSMDFMETGIGVGSGTWRTLTVDAPKIVQRLNRGAARTAARIRQGDALRLPFRPKSVTAVVTDPPYYDMIAYSDASDLFFVWLKRALGGVFPELFNTAGVQEKESEIIVKRVRGSYGVTEHRTSEFYKASLKAAFASARATLRDDGALTLVFGHGDPEAWRLLLSALMEGGYVLTGSWPARTEAATGAGSANIVVTITIACRPAPAKRADGLQATVDLEVEREIRGRVAAWERDGLALTDQLMAAYGPAMEVLGRYGNVLRPDGTPVEIDHYLSLARRVVQDVAAIKVDGLPLETFDARTRFALFWARLYGRQLAPKSEAVFQAMASNLQLDDVRKDILEESAKGYRLADFGEHRPGMARSDINATTATVDVVREMVRSWRAGGREGVAMVVGLSEREPDDIYLWSVISYLAGILPIADADRKALEDILRNRSAIGSARSVLERAASDAFQLRMFQDDAINSEAATSVSNTER